MKNLQEEIDISLLARTISNRPLLSEEEQKILYSKKIAIIGLSVGSQVALTLVRSGVGSHFTLIDPDVVELKNLNRTPFFLDDVGKKKSAVLSGQLSSIDPHLQIDCIDRVVNSDELAGIIENNDLVIDAFDDFGQKVLLRKYAQQYQKPIVTGFDIDKGAMVIIERYDLGDVDTTIFFNTNSPENLSRPSTTIAEKINKFISVIGEENHTPAMLEAVKNIGIKYAGIPQLMIATNLVAAAWSIAAVDILLKRRSSSLRKYINLESLIYS